MLSTLSSVVLLHKELDKLNQNFPMLGVTNLIVAIDKILNTEENQNTDEVESALETLGLIGTSKSCSYLIFSIFPRLPENILIIYLILW